MKTANITKALTALHLAAVIACACSIKEDRTVCPCVLKMDYSLVCSDDRIKEPDSLNTFLMIPSQFKIKGRVGEFIQGQSVSIERKDASLSCYFGYSPGRLFDSRLMIPEGSDSDPLYSYHEDLFIGPDTEEVTVRPALCAEFTRVVVTFVGNDTATKDLALRAVSGTVGFDFSKGKPVEGAFNCLLSPAGRFSFAFNMPRQASREIYLEVATASDLEPLFEIDLGKELTQASYDWNAVSLPPVVVLEIYRQNVFVQVKIMEWEEAVYFNTEL